jgi:hypothetical protein
MVIRDSREIQASDHFSERRPLVVLFRLRRLNGPQLFRFAVDDELDLARVNFLLRDLAGLRALVSTSGGAPPESCRARRAATRM